MQVKHWSALLSSLKTLLAWLTSRISTPSGTITRSAAEARIRLLTSRHLTSSSSIHRAIHTTQLTILQPAIISDQIRRKPQQLDRSNLQKATTPQRLRQVRVGMLLTRRPSPRLSSKLPTRTPRRLLTAYLCRKPRQKAVQFSKKASRRISLLEIETVLTRRISDLSRQSME